MVNAPSASSQPRPDEAKSQPGFCPPDCDLPENSKENLDARLDHAIEETFPTSDPISVMVTKKAVAPDLQEETSPASSSQSREAQSQAEQEAAEDLLDQVREALQDVAQTASGTVREAYRDGRRYVRRAHERYPEAERYYHKGRQAVQQRAAENPLFSLLMAGAVGYALAWMIHGERRGRDTRLPDYTRTRRGYAPHRDNQHAE